MSPMKILILLICISLTLQKEKPSYTNAAQLTWPDFCNTNTNQQSPIDIMTNSQDYMVNNNYIEVVSTNYPTMNNVARETVDNYHFAFVSDDTVKGSFTMKKDGEQYTFGLYDVHIHCGSEHRVNGKQYPCEIHMVHKRTIGAADRDQQRNLLVVGLLIEESATANPLFDGTSMDFSSYVTEKTKFHFYEGGLTTPGCNESVNWFVRTDIVSASASQLEKLTEWIKTEYTDVNGNARNTLTLGNRKIFRVDENNTQLTSAGFLLAKMTVVMTVLALLFF
jgi:carbonic anhydrase